MGKGAATAAEQPEVIVGQPTWIERGVPGRHGEVRVREYTPDGEPSGPRLVWVHGGGWVVEPTRPVSTVRAEPGAPL